MGSLSVISMRCDVMLVCLHSAKPLDSISMQTRLSSDLISSALLSQSFCSMLACSPRAALFIISTRLMDCSSSNLISSLIRLINSFLVNTDLYVYRVLSRFICPILFLISTSTLTFISGSCTSLLVLVGIPLR